METGVYIITCTANGARYVGSTAKSFRRRFVQHKHLLRHGRHHSPYLQNAWTKYGAKAFRFEPVIRCPVAEVLTHEQRLLDELKPEFNCLPIAGSSLGAKRSDEYRVKAAERQRRLNAARPDKGVGHLTRLAKTVESREMARERARHNWASGVYAGAGAKIAQALAKKHLVHGEMLTIRELAEKYGRTVKLIARRIERGIRGDELVAPPYKVSRRGAD